MSHERLVMVWRPFQPTMQEQRATFAAATHIGERLMLLAEAMDRSWYHCELRKRADDSDRTDVARTRVARAMRLLVFLSTRPDPIPRYLRNVAALYNQGRTLDEMTAAIGRPKVTIYVYIARARRLGLIERSSRPGGVLGQRKTCRGCGEQGHQQRACKAVRGGLRP